MFIKCRFYNNVNCVQFVNSDCALGQYVELGILFYTRCTCYILVYSQT